MKPKPEISMMIGAGPKLRPLEEVNMHKQAGAEIMMIESEGITEDLPPEKWRIDVIKKLDENFGFGRFMFEASDPPVFEWYLKNFGSNVHKLLSLLHGGLNCGGIKTSGRISQLDIITISRIQIVNKEIQERRDRRGVFS